MNKSIYKLAVLGFFGIGINAFAQTENYEGKVGVNTQQPNATLDVVAKNNTGATIEGFKTPQLTGDALKTMTSKLTADNDGLVVFVTTAVTTADASTSSVTVPGYYRFNFTENRRGLGTTSKLYAAKSWVRLEPTGLEFVIENNKGGRRLVGADEAKYGNIGTLAIDMSYSTLADGGATGDYSVAIGGNTKATATRSFAGGQNNVASGTNAVAIVGYQNTASGSDSFAGGNSSTASNTRAFAFGHKAQAKGITSVAFGDEAITEATATRAAAFGYKSKTLAENSAVFGEGTAIEDNVSKNSFIAGGVSIKITSSPNSMAYGANTTITGSKNAFVGGGNGTQIVGGDSSVALGNEVKVKGNGSIGLGSIVEVNGAGSVALGASAKVGTFAGGEEAKADNAIAIGSGTTIEAGATRAVAIGAGARATTADEVAIGNGKASSVVLGKLKTEAITEGGDCTAEGNGKLSYNGTDFLGCTGGKWVKLNN